MTLSQRIRKIRQEQKMTLKKMAEYLQVPTSTYRDWEYGSKIPAEMLIQISQLLNSSPNELLDFEQTQLKGMQKGISLIEAGLKLLKSA